MHCPKCGKRIFDDAKFCFACGAKVVPEKNNNSISPDSSMPKQQARYKDTEENKKANKQTPASKKNTNETYNMPNLGDFSRFSTASGKNLPYVVMQVTLKEKLFGTGSENLTDLEEVINAQVAKGYRLHTMSTSNGGSKGFGGGDRIQATLVFERLDLR